MINYAHRVASAYAPENTLAAFYLAQQLKANGLETDIQATSDGVLVLFHDDDLYRITQTEGKVSDFTYEQLLKLDFGSFKDPLYKIEKILKLYDFLRYFGHKPLKLALEIKQVGLEKEILDAVASYDLASQVVITSFSLPALIKTRELDSELKIGYLTAKIEDEILRELKDLKIGQICPNISSLTRQDLIFAKDQGFNVRAWGVKDERLMQKAFDLRVDGMTVDFPDKLAALMQIGDSPGFA